MNRKNLNNFGKKKLFIKYISKKRFKAFKKLIFLKNFAKKMRSKAFKLIFLNKKDKTMRILIKIIIENIVKDFINKGGKSFIFFIFFKI